MTKGHKVQIKLRLAQLISQCNSIMSITPAGTKEWEDARAARERLRHVWDFVNEVYSGKEIPTYHCSCGNRVIYENDLCTYCYSKMIEAQKH